MCLAFLLALCITGLNSFFQFFVYIIQFYYFFIALLFDILIYDFALTKNQVCHENIYNNVSPVVHLSNCVFTTIL